jgi:hypothetical protein
MKLITSDLGKVSIYFRKRFIEGRYECLHFVIDVWRDLTGTDLARPLERLLSAQKVDRATAAAFETIGAPGACCLVLLQAPFVRPHVGIWIDNKVLHLTQSGVEYVDLTIVMRNHKTVRFLCPKLS